MTMEITLRPITPADEAFLSRVYASTRMEELALTDWDDAQKTAFLTMQFTNQHRYYQENYTGAMFAAILAGAVRGTGREAVGRLYVARWPDEIRIIDITLLPEHRSRGIGTALLRGLQTEAAAVGKPLTIHVEKFNPALRLYGRLGFAPIADRGVYLLLRWSPDAPDAPDETARGQEKTAS